MYEIHAIKAFKDNYIWAIINPNTLHTAIVDPGDAEPVLAYLAAKDLILTAILLTHHHNDHIGGVAELLQNCDVPIYGPQSSNIKTVTNPVANNSRVLLTDQGLELQVREIPGHTLDHIAYYNQELVFSGDTLFTGGCGRIFEGTAEQMLSALKFMANLPGKTKVYCGHEYTVNNLVFAELVEPENIAIYKRLKQAEALREKFLATVPSTIHEELETNPFLRTNQSTVVDAAQKHANRALSDEVAVLAELRMWKNNI